MSSIKKVVIIILSIIVLLIIFMLFNINNNLLYKKEKSSTTQKYNETDWKSMKFKLNKDVLSINSKYKDFNNYNWYINFEKMGYKNGYKIDANSKTMMTLKLNNKYYYDLEVIVGLLNDSSKKMDAKESKVWAIYVNNYNKKTPINFTLPSNITNGVNFETIKNAYGNPNNIITEKDYKIYVYMHEYKIQLRLFVYNNLGLQAFEYKNY